MSLPKIARPRLRLINDSLSVLLVILAMYIFLLPVLPQFTWWAKHSVPVVSHSTRVAATVSPAKIPIPSDNRLVIPVLGLNEHIYEGASVYTVNKGVWIRPNGTTPDQGGNTIMVGHRFTYTNPRGVFYYLDKINIGDTIMVYWHGKGYIYKMTEQKVVSPDDATVEAPTTNQQLTLYTCTPLWNLHSRLVIIAAFQGVQT
jgi:LPXTG-site transpeptidase (sortase) family protein